MPRSALPFALILAGSTAAQAEMPRFGEAVQAIENQGSTRGAPASDGQPLRIQVSYQMQEAADRSASPGAQTDSLQAAHARLYRVIGQECAVITETFGGTCRIVSLNLGNTSQSYGPAPLTSYTASAVFELAAVAAAPGRSR